MNVLQILLLAWAAGLSLERRGDKLIVKGKGADAPQELMDLLREHKADLLRLMADHPVPEPE